MKQIEAKSQVRIDDILIEMKILSLLPAGSDIVNLLGLENFLVKEKVTSSLISNSLSSLEIDKKVRIYKHKGQSVFHINRGLLKKIDPDVVITQELCPVCAPTFTEVEKSCKILKKDYSLISLEPESIEGVFENIKTIAKFARREKMARAQISRLSERLKSVKLKTQAFRKPSVLVIEWLNPIMIAGHWVPEMIETAGGRMLAAKKGEGSKEVSWNKILKFNPDVLIIAPCGFDIKRTKKELDLIRNKKGFKNLKAVRNKKIFLVNGDLYLTRPGPKLVEGIEIIAQILYPQEFKRKYDTNSYQVLS